MAGQQRQALPAFAIEMPSTIPGTIRTPV